MRWGDSVRDASPNAGWPGAAMAGALGLKLAGPIAYDGVCQKKPWIGKGESSAGPADIRRALAIYVRACLYLWFLTGILKIGRASCRERVCQYVYIQVVAVSLKKKIK